MATNSNYSQFPQISLGKLIPGVIVGLAGLTIAGLIVGNWVMDMMDSSYRTEGRYAKMLQVTPPPPVIPKKSYLCPTGQTLPWIGCSIQ